jgi:PLP dependent protein
MPLNSSQTWTDDRHLIGDRLEQLKQQLPPQVKLVLVTKYVPSTTMRIAYELGVRDFGESKIQMATQKQTELADLTDIAWHLIGSLQSNKAKLAIAQFDWIHSLDRLSLAQQLDRLILNNSESSAEHKSENHPKSPKFLLQVKPASDPDKSGWEEEQLMNDLEELQNCQNLDLAGLMAILPLGLDYDQSLALFTKVATLRQKLSNYFPNLNQLSMGMSADYQAAIAAGTTMVRIGSQIFTQN